MTGVPRELIFLPNRGRQIRKKPVPRSALALARRRFAAGEGAGQERRPHPRTYAPVPRPQMASAPFAASDARGYTAPLRFGAAAFPAPAPASFVHVGGDAPFLAPAVPLHSAPFHSAPILSPAALPVPAASLPDPVVVLPSLVEVDGG